MGLAKGSHLRKGNIVERLLAALRRGGKAETVGGRDCDVGLACSIADSLLSAAKNDAHLHQCLKVSAHDIERALSLHAIYLIRRQRC